MIRKLTHKKAVLFWNGISAIKNNKCAKSLKLLAHCFRGVGKEKFKIYSLSVSCGLFG